jgi:arsenate reductase
MARVLFVCLHNAGRFQMSQALFERAADGRDESRSAGSQADPMGSVHSAVADAMQEVGIDLSARRPHRFTREEAALVTDFDSTPASQQQLTCGLLVTS